MVFHTLYIFLHLFGCQLQQLSISRTKRRRNLERFTLNRARFLFGCLSHSWSSRFQKCEKPLAFPSVYPSRTVPIEFGIFQVIVPLPLVGKTGATLDFPGSLPQLVWWALGLVLQPNVERLADHTGRQKQGAGFTRTPCPAGFYQLPGLPQVLLEVVVVKMPLGSWESSQADCKPRAIAGWMTGDWPIWPAGLGVHFVHEVVLHVVNDRPANPLGEAPKKEREAQTSSTVCSKMPFQFVRHSLTPTNASSLQSGAPKIAKLVYNSNNWDLW